MAALASAVAQVLRMAADVLDPAPAYGPPTRGDEVLVIMLDGRELHRGVLRG